VKQRTFSARRQACRLVWVLFAAACQGAPASRPAATEPAHAEAPASPEAPALPEAEPKPVPVKDETPPVQVRAEGQLGPGSNTLFIDIAAPEGAKLTLDSPLSVRGSGGIGLSFPRRLSGTLSAHPMPLRLPIEVSDGATGPARVEVTYYWCTDGNEAACRREQAFLNVELDLTGANAGGEAHLSYKSRGDRS
jgi:hypothetical protein